MPELTWLGKDAIRFHHLEVPYRPFVPTATFEAPGTAADAPWHRIIHGDNLDALKSLLPEFEGRVKCIYIDPPYNTGNEQWAYNDNVSDPRLLAWLGRTVGKEAEDLTRHDKWLCMMYPRLQLLHKLLSDDGLIFVSIGDDELFNLERFPSWYTRSTLTSQYESVFSGFAGARTGRPPGGGHASGRGRSI